MAAPHPHAPELGWLPRLLGAFHVTGVFWFKLPYYGLRPIPGFALPAVVFSCSAVFWLLLRRIRAALAANLEAVLGPCGFWQRQWRMFRAIHTFAWCNAERYEFLYGRPFSVEVEGGERLESALRAGAGVIFVTAHIGTWETASHALTGRLDRHVHVVREEELDPRAQRFIETVLKQRVGQAAYTTHFATDDPRLALTLAAALRKGDAVALQGDRPRAGSRTWTARLFGKPMPLPLGPAALARATGAPLVPIFSFRSGHRSYRVCLREPIFVAGRSDTAGLQPHQATERLASEIEWAIRREPYQWFCFKRLWA